MQPEFYVWENKRAGHKFGFARALKGGASVAATTLQQGSKRVEIGNNSRWKTKQGQPAIVG